jgi:hypothetical protein
MCKLYGARRGGGGSPSSDCQRSESDGRRERKACAGGLFMATDTASHPVAGAGGQLYRKVSSLEPACPDRGRCPIAPVGIVDIIGIPRIERSGSPDATADPGGRGPNIVATIGSQGGVVDSGATAMRAAGCGCAWPVDVTRSKVRHPIKGEETYLR